MASQPVSRRRKSIAEEASESFIDLHVNTKKQNKKKSFKDILLEAKNEIYNSEFREFLTRDAKSWFKLSLFYAFFFVSLAIMFSFLLFAFYKTIDPKTPTYFNESSVMNYKIVNPGLGFRPQLDPESDLIKLDTTDLKRLEATYIDLFKLFLKPYEEKRNRTFTGYKDRNVTFDYRKIIDDTPCSVENDFGFTSQSPCVAVKLNRIYGWMPKASSLPSTISSSSSNAAADQTTNNSSATEDKKQFIYILCEGETAVDKDNMGPIEYYSEYPGRAVGGLHLKYYPYKNQDGYLSPLVFVHFKKPAVEVLINIICKAHARNIDNSDRSNLRGMVRFQIYLKNSTDIVNNLLGNNNNNNHDDHQNLEK